MRALARQGERIAGKQAWLLLLPACGGVLIAVPPSYSVAALGLWGVATFALISAMAVDRFSASGTSPVLIVCGLAAVYGVVVPVTLARRRDTYLLGTDYSSWFWAASAVCAGAAAAFCLGYHLAKPRPAVSVNQLFQADPLIHLRLERLAVVIGIGAAILFLYTLARYGIGGYAASSGQDAASTGSAYVAYAPQYLVGTSLFLWHRGSKPLLRRLAIAACLMAALYFYLTGIRYLLVTTLAAGGLLLYWRRARSELPPLRHLLVAVILGVAMLGFIGHTRSQGIRSDLTTRQSAENSFEITRPLAGVIAHTETSGFIFGSSYTYLFVQIIPRSLWPEKPLPPTYLALAEFTEISEGRTFPIWGEMYLNFGWYGVLGGMALFGYAIRKWLLYWRRHRATSYILDILAALTIALLVQWVSRGLFVQLVYNTMGFALGPLILVLRERQLCKRRRSRIHKFVLTEYRTAPPLSAAPRQ